MPRSSIEMKALIKTDKGERVKERSQEKGKLSNKIQEMKQKRKDLDKIRLTVNPLVRFFVLPKIT